MWATFLSVSNHGMCLSGVCDQTHETETPIMHVIQVYNAWVSILACNRLHTEVFNWGLESPRNCYVMCNVVESSRTGLPATATAVYLLRATFQALANFMLTIVSRSLRLCRTTSDRLLWVQPAHCLEAEHVKLKGNTLDPWAGTGNLVTIVSCSLACLLLKLALHLVTFGPSRHQVASQSA